MELINLEYALQQIEIGEFEHRGVFESDSSHIKDFLNALPIVDAVPVDEIIFHHILIDENGIPEVRLQFGEKIMILRREDDPVDVAQVVRGHWIVSKHGLFRDVKCSVCGKDYACHYGMLQLQNFSYCPNCGAKMEANITI